MGYFNFYIIKKIINSLFNYIRKNKRFIIIFIIFVCILFIKEKCFAVDVVDDMSQEIINKQEIWQNAMVCHFLPEYLGNTDAWVNQAKPMFETMASNGYSLYTSMGSNNTYRRFRVLLYHLDDGTNQMGNWADYMTGVNSTIRMYRRPNTTSYLFDWYYSNNTQSLTIDNTYTLFIPEILKGYMSDLLIEFLNTINGQSFNDYSSLLTSISTYLDSINSVDNDILLELQDISSALVSIDTNTSTNYSQQIGQISSKISDILSDNDTIISQNASMIAEQEQINDNLEAVNDSVQEVKDSVTDLKDTITDDTIESSAEDLPSTDVNDPTQTGIDNIFQSIYNAFCVGQAQDIVFPIPFTNKNITLSPYYVRDMLNNNGAGWVYGLIQAFWGYLIGRFIIKDILNKITKIKSGNIEEIQNDNIKGEML